MGLDPSSKPRKVVVTDDEAFENKNEGRKMYDDDGNEV